MPVEIINVEQGTSDWFAARAGIPTASEFHSILAKGKGGQPSATRRKYMIKLATEVLTGKPSKSFRGTSTPSAVTRWRVAPATGTRCTTT